MGDSQDDSADFDEFYSATSRRVLGHVYVMTGDLGEAEDAVAEAYLRAWDRWRTVRTAASPEAWVRRVASRQAISSWRKAVNRVRAHDRATPRVQTASLDPVHVAVVAALRRISPHQRRAIVLHHLVGLDVAEVAAEVGAPIGTVKARLARGRAAMAPHLADDPDHPDRWQVPDAPPGHTGPARPAAPHPSHVQER